MLEIKQQELHGLNDCPRALGLNIVIKLFLPPEYYTLKTAGGLHLPETSKENLVYNAISGTVCAVGPDAYVGKGFGAPWCKVGDMVVFARHEGQRVLYKGHPFVLLPDTMVRAAVDDPSLISASFVPVRV